MNVTEKLGLIFVMVAVGLVFRQEGLWVTLLAIVLFCMGAMLFFYGDKIQENWR